MMAVVIHFPTSEAPAFQVTPSQVNEMPCAMMEVTAVAQRFAVCSSMRTGAYSAWATIRLAEVD